MASDAYYREARKRLGPHATWYEVYQAAEAIEKNENPHMVYEEELDVLHIHKPVLPAMNEQELAMRLQNVEVLCKKLREDRDFQARFNDILLERLSELERTAVRFSQHRVDL